MSVNKFFSDIKKAADGFMLPDKILTTWFKVEKLEYTEGIISGHRELFHGIVPLDTSETTISEGSIEDVVEDVVPLTSEEQSTTEDVKPLTTEEGSTTGSHTRKGIRPPSRAKRRRKKRKGSPVPVQYTLHFKKN